MARKIIAWVTDEQFEEWERRVEETGVEFKMLGTWLLCRWLNPDLVPPLDKKKKLGIWLLEQELSTKGEYERNGGGTLQKVEAMMREDLRAWSTTEIKQGLGWRKPGQLNELLRESPKFEKTTKPEEVKLGRGAPPNWWKLKG